MFEKFNLTQKEIIYRALKAMVDSNSGIGFHNADQGNPFYVAGAGDLPKPFPDADGPDTNVVFKMLSELSRDFKKSDYTGFTWWYDFSEWKSFCKFAVDAYNRNKGSKPSWA